VPTPPRQHPRPAHDARLHLPNALTVLRLVLAIGFFGLLHAGLARAADDLAPMAGIRWWLLGAAALFIVAAITDFLDGYLARRWQAVSRFGRVMDPFADKILVLGALVSLASPRFQLVDPADAGLYQATAVAPWMIIVILARELLVTSIRGVYEREGIDFSAAWSGKAKMLLQSLVVPAVLALVALVPVEPGSPGRWAVLALVWATVLVTAVSGLPYILRAFDAAPAAHQEPGGGFRLFALTVLGLGFLRPAPGTWGSMPVPVLLGMIWLGGGAPAEPGSPSWIAFHALLLLVLLAACATCIACGRWAEARFGRSDPREVVADETAGQVIPFLFLPPAAWSGFWPMVGTLSAGFLLFRVLDVVKPPPAAQSQRLPAGWGILVDDLIAGAMALAIMQLAWRVML